MAKYICMTCGWKGDSIKEHESETSDIRLIKPNYPRIAKSPAKPEKSQANKELEAANAEIERLKKELDEKTPKE